jgi:Tol biopolymer transport system component/tRNA A-37 threonylcarbamoyl transferase component Bud32
MAIAAGTRLGQYDILGLIGAGGMGEVYRGHDTKLDRDVAIKVLPPHFARDPERLARFRREATLLAALNHPNIAQIYGVEDSGDTHYLVMEFVPGLTLAERVISGPVEVDEALRLASQMAEALEHAHEKTVIHRDLKPANVKVTPEGKVKVLDFGLAKAFAGDSAASAPPMPALDSNSPTLSRMPEGMGGAGASPTIPGVILGTAAYMSPEQAKGKTVDRRTDIWALGCVLYELLTARPAFTGDSVTEILGAVMRGEPDWSLLPEATPPAIRALLRRCLRKDLQQRPRDAADIRLELDDSRAAASAVSPRVVAQTAAPAPRRWLLLGALACVVVAALTGITVWTLRPAPAIKPVTRFVLTLPPTQQLPSVGTGSNLALSPDGTQLAYVAATGSTQQLYLRPVDSLESKPLPGTDGAVGPFFSPDGQWIGFTAAGTGLKKVSVNGGPPLTLGISSTTGATWGPNGMIVYSPTPASPLFEVSSDGGTAQPLTALDFKRGELGHRFPNFLPDGKAFFFDAVAGGGTDIIVQRLETGERRVLIQGGSNARYLASGHLVFYREGILMAAPFDLKKLDVRSAAVPVLESVSANSNAAVLGVGVPQFSVSTGGSLAYVPGGPQGLERTLVWVDRKGTAQPVAAPARTYTQPSLSPDGRKLAVTIQVPKADIWIYDFSRGTLTRLTFDGFSQRPLWTPNGQRIAFSSARGGPANVFWRPADGTGTDEQITKIENLRMHASISPDGKLAFYAVNNPSGHIEFGMVSLEGEHKTSVLLQGPFNVSVPKISPDGHWLAYSSDESGRWEIYVRPFPGSGGKWQISTDGGAAPLWAPNGKELFYVNGNQMMAVDVRTGPAFNAGTPKMLFEGSYDQRGGGNGPNFDISPDGQRFLMIKTAGQPSASGQINVVLNWFEELKAKVPVGK